MLEPTKPRTRPKAKKTATLNIRLPEGGKEALQMEAEKYGFSVSEFIRFLIFEEIRRHQRGETPNPELLASIKCGTELSH